MKRVTVILLFVLISALLPNACAAESAGMYKAFFEGEEIKDLSGWQIPEGTVVDSVGLSHKDTEKTVLYTAESFFGKYEYSVDFLIQFQNSVRIIFNYIDEKNYYYAEINPQSDIAAIKTFRRGSITTAASGSFALIIDPAKTYHARVVSNGGAEVSFYISDENGEYSVFESVYVEDFISGGYIGFDSQSNPLRVNNFKVNALGEADFKIPVKEAEKETGDIESEEIKPIDYDDSVLKIISAFKLLNYEKYEDGIANASFDDLSQLAIMTGLQGTLPQAGDITLNDALSFMMRILGYDVFINTDNNLYLQAGKLKILKNINRKADEKILKHELARLVYNCFNVELLYSYSYKGKYDYKTYKGRTFLTETLGCDYVEGQITDNGITALASRSTIGEQKIKIGDTVLYYGDTDIKKNDFIGRYVNAYYKTNENETGTLIYMQLSLKEEALVIHANQYVDFNKDEFKYIDNENKKAKTVKVQSGIPLIYNGYYVASFTNELFEGMTQGSITLVSGKNEDYAVIIVKDYKDMIINKIDTANMIVFNKSQINNDSISFDSLCLDKANGSYITIYDAAGNELPFSELKVNDVLSVLKNGDVVEAVVCNEIINGFKINETYTDADGRIYISDLSSTYEVTSNYTKSKNTDKLSIGYSASLYLNVFSNIVWADNLSRQELQVGCLVNSALSNDIEQLTEIVVYEADGERQIFKTAPNVRFRNSNGELKKLKGSQLSDELNGRHEVIAYTLNEDDIITYLEMPLDSYDASKENYLTKLCDVESGIYRYKNTSRSYGSYKYFFSPAPRIFSTAVESIDDINEYFIIQSPSSLTNWSTYKMKLYSVKNDKVIDYAILYDYEKPDAKPRADSKEMLVTSVALTLNEDGEEVYNIKGFTNSAQIVDGNKDAAENMAGIFTVNNQNAPTYMLQKGDIIKYRINPTTGEADNFVLVFRSSISNPVSNSYGYMPGESSVITNPFAVDNSYKLLNNPKNRESGQRRYIYGWAYAMDGNILTVTTEDLSDVINNADYNPSENSNYTTEYHLLDSYVFTTFTHNKHKNEYIAANGKISDIKTFKDTGGMCSRVLIAITDSSNSFNVTIFN